MTWVCFVLHGLYLSYHCTIKNTLNSQVMFCDISAIYKTLNGCWICELAFQDVQRLNTSCCPDDSCLTIICSNCPARDHPLTGQTVTTPHWHGVQPLWTMDVWCLHFLKNVFFLHLMSLISLFCQVWFSKGLKIVQHILFFSSVEAISSGVFVLNVRSCCVVCVRAMCAVFFVPMQAVHGSDPCLNNKNDQ